METHVVREIVENAFPDDCALIGQTNLEQLLNAPDVSVRGTRIPGQHNIAIEASLGIVAASIALVRQMFLLYRDLRREYGRPPTAEELKDKSQSSISNLPVAVIDKLIDLARSVLKYEHSQDDRR